MLKPYCYNVTFLELFIFFSVLHNVVTMTIICVSKDTGNR